MVQQTPTKRYHRVSFLVCCVLFLQALQKTMAMKAATAAQQKGLFQKTPLILSDPISKLVGTDVYLKLDALQPSGSFKDRGMGHLCLDYYDKGVKKLVSSSGGNAGLAASTVANKLNMEIQVVVPKTTKKLVIDKLESLGANVKVHGDNWNQADAYVQQLVQSDPEAAYVPPYEHEKLWEGHSSVIDEVYEEMNPSAVVLSVGGGGLLCGVLEGLQRYDSKAIVFAAETEGAGSFGKAMSAGKLQSLAAITSVATSLGALQVSPSALERSRAYGNVQSVLCTDKEAIDACLQFARDHRILVEPACGASLAVVYSERLRTKYDLEGPIVVEVCGGSGVNVDLLQQWKNDFGL